VHCLAVLPWLLLQVNITHALSALYDEAYAFSQQYAAERGLATTANKPAAAGATVAQGSLLQLKRGPLAQQQEQTQQQEQQQVYRAVRTLLCRSDGGHQHCLSSCLYRRVLHLAVLLQLVREVESIELSCDFMQKEVRGPEKGGDRLKCNGMKIAGLRCCLAACPCPELPHASPSLPL
jgi:hypothetical protein